MLGHAVAVEMNYVFDMSYVAVDMNSVVGGMSYFVVETVSEANFDLRMEA